MEIVYYNISWKKQDKKLKLYVQYDPNCVLKWAEKRTLKINIAQYDQINQSQVEWLFSFILLLSTMNLYYFPK